MKKTDEQLDRLHESVMQNLYEIFEEEFDAYFLFQEAALGVLEFGSDHFPFSGIMDNAENHIEKALEAIEANLLHHIDNELKFHYEEREKVRNRSNRYSAELKTRLSNSIKKSIKEIIGKKVTTIVPTQKKEI